MQNLWNLLLSFFSNWKIELPYFEEEFNLLKNLRDKKWILQICINQMLIIKYIIYGDNVGVLDFQFEQ